MGEYCLHIAQQATSRLAAKRQLAEAEPHKEPYQTADNIEASDGQTSENYLEKRCL